MFAALECYKALGYSGMPHDNALVYQYVVDRKGGTVDNIYVNRPPGSHLEVLF